MTPEQQQEFDQMKAQVAELLAWKQARTEQQLVFPLDQRSKDIVTKDVPLWTGVIVDVPPLVPGAICTLNGKPWAFHIESPSDYT